MLPSHICFGVFWEYPSSPLSLLLEEICPVMVQNNKPWKVGSSPPVFASPSSFLSCTPLRKENVRLTFNFPTRALVTSQGNWLWLWLCLIYINESNTILFNKDDACLTFEHREYMWMLAGVLCKNLSKEFGRS